MKDSEKENGQREIVFDEKTDYLALPAKELLSAYGSGRHIPGSGSAAVLSALLAVEMMRTVCKISLKKKEYQQKWTRCEFILSELETKTTPDLNELFKRDIAIFNRVSIFRSQRDDAETDVQRAHWERVQLDELKMATEIPLEVSRICLGLLPKAFFLFDNGYKAVRGDSGVAVSNLLSSISGALFIISLNLRSFRKSEWVDGIREEVMHLTAQFENYQGESSTRILSLYNEEKRPEDNQLSFPFFRNETESQEGDWNTEE